MKETDYTFKNALALCDNLKCNSEMTIDETDFSRVNVELRSYGWITTKIGKEYVDFCCKECMEAYKMNRGELGENR